MANLNFQCFATYHPEDSCNFCSTFGGAVSHLGKKEALLPEVELQGFADSCWVNERHEKIGLWHATAACKLTVRIISTHL